MSEMPQPSRHPRPPPAPPRWEPSSAQMQQPHRSDKVGKWVKIGLGVTALAIIGGTLANKKKDDSTPSKPAQTICELIADPSHDILTTGDIADLAHMSTRGLRAYVADHCPELLYRVT